MRMYGFPRGEVEVGDVLMSSTGRRYLVGSVRETKSGSLAIEGVVMAEGSPNPGRVWHFRWRSKRQRRKG